MAPLAWLLSLSKLSKPLSAIIIELARPSVVLGASELLFPSMCVRSCESIDNLENFRARIFFDVTD